MKYNIIRIQQGQITDDQIMLNLVQLCNKCNLSPDLIIEMVEEGIVDPIGTSKTKWRFSFSELENVRKIIRIRNDLKVNLARAALALQLLDRIEQLESVITLQNAVSKSNL